MEAGNADVYLIPAPQEHIRRPRPSRGVLLPSQGDVLSVLVYHLQKKNTLNESLKLVVKEAQDIWVEVGLPVGEQRKVCFRVEKLYFKWVSLKKNRRRDTANQARLEKEFAESLNTICEVGKQGVTAIVPPQDLQDKLNAARSGETVYFKILQPHQHTTEEGPGEVPVPQIRLPGPNIAPGPSSTRVLRSRLKNRVFQLAKSSGESSGTTTSTEDIGPEYLPPRHSKKRRLAEDLTPDLLATLERAGASVRNGARILLTALQELRGVESGSVSTVYRLRLKTRAVIADTVKRDFICRPPMVAHFDEKRMEDLKGEEKVEWLAVHVTGPDGVEQFLGAPPLQSGTGRDQANAVANLLREWNIEPKVRSFLGQSISYVCI